MALPNKIVSMSPAEMRDTINALIELIEANNLHNLKCGDLSGAVDLAQLTFISDEWIPRAAADGGLLG